VHGSICWIYSYVSAVALAGESAHARLKISPFVGGLGRTLCLANALARQRAGLSPSPLWHEGRPHCAVACCCNQRRGWPAQCARSERQPVQTLSCSLALSPRWRWRSLLPHRVFICIHWARVLLCTACQVDPRLPRVRQQSRHKQRCRTFGVHSTLERQKRNGSRKSGQFKSDRVNLQLQLAACCLR
jgi:hypothetical protein